MAWISVHESVIGPKLRDLYKTLGCSSFEAIGILNVVWLWGLSNANKEGLILSADKGDIARHLYGTGAGCKLDASKIVDALFSSGWIDETENGYVLHDWDEWQEYWYSYIERKEKDAKRKRESRLRTSTEPTQQSSCSDEEQHIETRNNNTHVPDEEPKPIIPDDPPEPKPDAKKRNAYPKSFEEFWEVYPRNDEKGGAYKKYKARLNDGYSHEELIEAAKGYASKCKRMKTQKEYIKQAKTFLGDSCPFIDFLPKEEKKPSTVVGGKLFSELDEEE